MKNLARNEWYLTLRILLCEQTLIPWGEAKLLPPAQSWYVICM